MTFAFVLAAALSAATPDPASAAQAEQGRVMLKCTLNPDGSAHPCTVQSETPSGLGLGERALGLIKHTRLNPARGAGVVLVPMVFPIIDADTPAQTSPAP